MYDCIDAYVHTCKCDDNTPDHDLTQEAICGVNSPVICINFFLILLGLYPVGGSGKGGVGGVSKRSEVRGEVKSGGKE